MQKAALLVIIIVLLPAAKTALPKVGRRFVIAVSWVLLLATFIVPFRPPWTACYWSSFAR